jgi:hypothetical protein
MNSKDI